jgi:hypothetical protein
MRRRPDRRRPRSLYRHPGGQKKPTTSSSKSANMACSTAAVVDRGVPQGQGVHSDEGLETAF